MTMLTSLKALLFPTPAQTGVKGDAAPTDGSAGFAQLLNSMGTAPTPVAQPITPAPVIENGDDDADNIVEYQHIDENSWRPAFSARPSPAVAADPVPDVEKPQLAVQLAVARSESEATPAVVISAPAPTEAQATPVTAKDVLAPHDPVLANDIAVPADVAPVAVVAEAEAAIPLPEQSEGAVATPSPAAPVTLAEAPITPAAMEQEAAPSRVKLHHGRPHEAAPLDTPAQSLPAETPDAPEAAKPSSDDVKPAVQADSQASVQPTVTAIAPPAPVASPIAVSPATVPTETAEIAAMPVDVARPTPALRPAAVPVPKGPALPETPVESASIAIPSTPDAPASPPPATPMRSSIVPNDTAPTPADAEPLSPDVTAPAANVTLSQAVEPAPISADLPVEQPSIGNPVSDTTRPTSQAATPIPLQDASPVSATAPALEAAAAPPVAVATAPLANAVTTTADTTVAPPALEPAEGMDQPLDSTQAAPHTAPAKPRAEAVSLLQLVRDHMSLRAPRRTESVAAVSDASPDTAPAILPTAVNDSATPLAPLVQPAGQPLATAALTTPTVDLSASLGAQVVDMGVSGQWIDGLARDIAGLSANGAQGRFQINATELGPIQVDIRQGDDGAAISLTVATEAAEQALRQDSDRLKLDASLSAVRISDVKIERAPQPVEAARADGTASQSATQHQSGGSSQNPGQAAGQNMGQSSAQSHMQGRGQQRENIAFGHKAGNDGAVLNHMDAGDTAGGAARARYA